MTTAPIHPNLLDRLRGQYAIGPHLPNGLPEFGFRQFEAPPIQHEAAAAIELLRAVLRDLLDASRIACTPADQTQDLIEALAAGDHALLVIGEAQA